jgi:hypothetical protein
VREPEERSSLEDLRVNRKDNIERPFILEKVNWIYLI